MMLYYWIIEGTEDLGRVLHIRKGEDDAALCGSLPIEEWYTLDIADGPAPEAVKPYILCEECWAKLSEEQKKLLKSANLSRKASNRDRALMLLGTIARLLTDVQDIMDITDSSEIGSFFSSEIRDIVERHIGIAVNAMEALYDDLSSNLLKERK